MFFDWLRAKRPDLVERYERLYRRGAYVPEAERRGDRARRARFRAGGCARTRSASTVGGRSSPACRAAAGTGDEAAPEGVISVQERLF